MSMPLLTASAATASHPYSGFVKSLLGIDLALCVGSALLALLAMPALLKGDFGAFSPTLAMGKVGLQGATAVFGTLGNLLLLRRRRTGFWLCCISLVFVSAGMVLTFSTLRVTLEGLDDTQRLGVLIGFSGTLLVRFLFNLVYAFALQRAWRALHTPAGTPQA